MRRAVVVLMLAVLTVGACTRTAGEPGGTGAPTATASSRAGVPGRLDFIATTLDGAAFDGASLAGKPAVLWFWAPWCPTCAGQARGVKTTAEQLAGKVTVVGVGGLDKTPAMRTFVGQWHLEAVPHLADEAGIVWKRFGVTAQSTFVFLDASGAVVYQGALSGDDLPGLAGRLA
ncbi:redoxin family protein [Dactylosporangium sp. NBC_01737]|uniref:redoxin family protein n=1 Tax=Dactylosporangium sp. NBC_01737 TaxID=2975959 RepID=UPI002E10A521|nr:redoxin family protein [Dactylosporangium sp. NBC_01737]